MKKHVNLDHPTFREFVLELQQRSTHLSVPELFAEVQRRFPRLDGSQLRTFRRRIAIWSGGPLLAELRRSKTIQIVIGVRHSDLRRRRDLHEGFDVETAGALGGLIAPGGQTTLEWNRLAKSDENALDDLVATRKSLISVGSPVSNPFTGFLLKRLFEINPGRSPNGDWPFWFCWPGRKPTGPFERTVSELQQLSLARFENATAGRERPHRIEELQRQAGYAFGWKRQMYFIDLLARAEASQDYGLILARRAQHGSGVWVCLVGGSGPGTLAAASWLVTDGVEDSLPDYSARKVLCAPVVAQVAWREQLYRVDQRVCNSVDMLKKPCLIDCFDA